MKINPASLYQQTLLQEHRRVLGMMDRDARSRTFGCLDRTYWSWKFTDFPGARFQEGVCTLAYLYTHEFEGNPLCGNEALRGWLQGGFRYWAQIQNRDGDFNEAYPGERSLAATAFTGFYMAEAHLLLEGRLDDEIVHGFRKTLRGVAEWLTVNDESHGFLSNHLAAAAAALLHASRILSEPRYFERYRYFLDKILAHQSKEGWYEEYGGADPGYQTHGTFYLARCWELTDDDELLGSLQRACEFLKHFIHPDRSLGGEYASRNTQTYYPAGFEMLSGRSGAARWIAETMRESVLDGRAAGLVSVDPYNYFVLMNNYVFALRAVCKDSSETVEREPPSEDSQSWSFPRAGLLKVRRRQYDLFVGLSKGGVVKLFDRQRQELVFSSCGYLGRLSNGKDCSSQSFVVEPEATLDGERTVIKAPFYIFARPLMTPFKFLLFRIFTLTTGRFSAVAAWLKRLLVRVLIYRKQEVGLHLERTIETQEDGITIVDRIAGADLQRIERLEHRSVFTTIHMGSSRYFVPHELALPEIIETVIERAGQATEPIEKRHLIRVRMLDE